MFLFFKRVIMDIFEDWIPELDSMSEYKFSKIKSVIHEILYEKWDVKYRKNALGVTWDHTIDEMLWWTSNKTLLKILKYDKESVYIDETSASCWSGKNETYEFSDDEPLSHESKIGK